MEQLHSRCAGLDVHKETVVACIRIRIDTGKKVSTEVRTFATTTIGLLALADWLGAHKCSHVAMEATGVYWKPVWHVLEERFQLVLANAAHIKNVPGRKTDVKDAEWIAGLLAHGLIQASFVPPTPIQAIRDLTRTRKQLTREQSRHVQRVHKVYRNSKQAVLEFVVLFELRVTGGVTSLGQAPSWVNSPGCARPIARMRFASGHTSTSGTATGKRLNVQIGYRDDATTVEGQEVRFRADDTLQWCPPRSTRRALDAAG